MQTNCEGRRSFEASPSGSPHSERGSHRVSKRSGLHEELLASKEQPAAARNPPDQIRSSSSGSLTDSIMDDATQPATQPYNDPRRLGRNNSGMSDDDLMDVICILHPMNPLALQVVKQMMVFNPHHVLQNDDLLDGVDPDDLQMNLMMNSPRFERDLALRMSSPLKNPAAGFTFGRNRARCDILLANEQDKNISNIHFSIFLNANGILMLEDLSTNGTCVENRWFKKAEGPQRSKIMLQPNVDIAVISRSKEHLSFMVRYPSRGEYAEAYSEKMRKYIAQRPGMEGTGLLPSVSSYDTSYGMHWNGGTIYNVVGHLGKGAFATVYKLATKSDGKVFAAKELDKRRFMKNGILDLKIENEMKIMSSLRHPNIVQYEGFHDYKNWIYIIMEFIPGGELSTYISQHGPIPERVGQDITRQILHALDYLHVRKITHRDIKPDNLLIANFNPLTVKLSDFGLSKCVTDQETFLKTFCGTLLYCAPEVYPDYSNFRENTARIKRRRGDPPSKTSPYSQAVDMWSFGAVLYHILCNKPPVIGKGDDRGIHMLHNIMTKDIDYSPLRAKGISEEGIDFVNALLNRDPDLRPNEQTCFQHKWIVDIPDHLEYGLVADEHPLEYYDALATVDELDEDVWDDPDAPQYHDTGKDNIIPDDAEVEMGVVKDRSDPRYQSKRQRLRGGDQIGETYIEQGDAGQIGLPKTGVSPAKSVNTKQVPRLFGEISQSALRSSGIFGHGQKDVTDLPALRKSVENISVNDFVHHEGGSAGIEMPAETDIQYDDHEHAPSGPQSTAPSLFGAEAEFEDLNMTSPAAHPSRGATPDVSNPTTPKTREATPAEIEEFEQVNNNRMAPPPLPAGFRPKSAPKAGELSAAGPVRQMSSIPATIISTTSEVPSNVLEGEGAGDQPELQADPEDETTDGSPSINAQQSAIQPFETKPILVTNTPHAPTIEPLFHIPSHLGRLLTVPGSIITAELPLTALRTVYGRGTDSTIKYPDLYDVRIPQYGLKLTFHGTDILDLESWLRLPGNTFSFIPGLYVSITTSARKGIWVNGIYLPNQDAKEGGWYWGQIQSGDVVTLYEGDARNKSNGEKEFLRFRIEIYYGDSARRREDVGEPFAVLWQQKKASGDSA